MILDRIEMNRMIDVIRPGDVIGFSGRNWISAGINVATFGVPLWGISHVGIVGHWRRDSLEVEYYPSLPTLFDSTRGHGVRSRDLYSSINSYNGRVWLYQISRPLFLNESRRLTARLNRLLGRKYDTVGAMRSGGLLTKTISALIHGEDLTSLFCSEFVAEQLSYIGMFPTANASRWSPNHLIRKMRRMGVINPPIRIK